MSIGMSYDEFWTGECNRTVAYRKANYKRLEAQNQAMWLQGIYFYNAISVVLAGAFSKKGANVPKYFAEPIKIMPKTGLELKREEERERKKAIEALSAWEKTWKIQHK